MSTPNEPETIDELLDRDPESHSKETFQRLLNTYREQGNIWFEEERAAKTTGRKASTSKGMSRKKKPRVSSINIDELDLGL